MPEFLNNPWFVSIVCGLIAAAIGFGASRAFDNLYNKRLASRIKSANDLTISQFEVYLVNSSKPSYEVLNALRCNAARRFNVSVDKLFSVGACIEAVVSGIISNVYLNTDQQRTHLTNVSAILSMCTKSYADDHPRHIPPIALPASIGFFVTILCLFYLDPPFSIDFYGPKMWIIGVLFALIYALFIFFAIYLLSTISFMREARLYNEAIKRQESESNAGQRAASTDTSPQEFPQSVSATQGESDGTSVDGPETPPDGK